ncbi:hypothetical protein M422DRAFT_778362 [Sphaerobolus stellatus SS14]|uniref:Peptidase C14 caspase domain-containing protein n=1 Tax=Sphaerobolus stellatus (strain SS14) TaxID=990650 RepID=A0A0C9VUM9_SPHS4|nr:hypothetical protein M422DRAFT_778362 [Sphaerobolus stellatus SS14]
MFALIIGIDSYPNANKRLKGAVNDAQAFRKYLVGCLRVPDSKRNITLLLNEKATKANIIRNLQALKTNSHINYGDPILIFFAGHGAEANPPPEWESRDKIQLILPYDYALKSLQPQGRQQRNTDLTYIISPGHILRNVIADRLFGALLDDICHCKGDNITVILDCCYSGSGTRYDSSPDGEDNLLFRREEIPPDVVFDPDIDEDGSDAYRAMSHCSEFYDKGTRSHMLLAACSKDELAREENGRGNFTRALLNLLRTSNVRDLTYACLLRRIEIKLQNPQCEGYNRNRTLFNLGVSPSTMVVWYSIEIDKDKCKLHAGTIDGVALGDEFAIYPDRTLCESPGKMLFKLQVQRSCTISDFETVFPLLNSTDIPLKPGSYPVAVRTRNGQEVELRMLDDRCRDKLKKIQHPGVLLVVTKSIQHMFGLDFDEQGQVCLRLFCSDDLQKYGLPRQIPYKPPVDKQILLAAAHYHRCFKYVAKTTPDISLDFRKAIIIEKELEMCTVSETQAIGENLINKGMVEITPQTEDRYTLTITNKSNKDLTLNVLYFDHMDLSISSFFTPNLAGKFEADATLKAHDCITVGDGSGGGPPIKFTFSEGNNLELGYLKVFLTSENVDLSNLQQDSILEDTRKAGLDDQKLRTAASAAIRFIITKYKDKGYRLIVPDFNLALELLERVQNALEDGPPGTLDTTTVTEPPRASPAHSQPNHTLSLSGIAAIVKASEDRIIYQFKNNPIASNSCARSSATRMHGWKRLRRALAENGAVMEREEETVGMRWLNRKGQGHQAAKEHSSLVIAVNSAKLADLLIERNITILRVICNVQSRRHHCGLRDATYPISTLAAEAIRHSQNVVANASKDDKTRLQDTPGVETFFWNLWERIFTLTEEDVSTHSRSIAFINAVKASRAGDTEKRWAAHSTPAGWCHLPLLFAVAQDGWDDLHLPLSERERSSSPVQFVLEGGKPERNNRVVTVAAQARTQYLNSQRIIARLLVDAWIDVSFFADRALRAALKKASGEAHDDTAIVDDSMDEDMDVSMASTSAQTSGFTLHDIIDVDAIDSDDESDDEYDPDAAEVESEDEDVDADIDDVEISDAPAGLELEAASIWLSIAGKELYKLKETKSKWPSLRRVFTDAANGGGRKPVVIDAAPLNFTFYLSR